MCFVFGGPPTPVSSPASVGRRYPVRRLRGKVFKRRPVLNAFLLGKPNDVCSSAVVLTPMGWLFFFCFFFAVVVVYAACAAQELATAAVSGQFCQVCHSKPPIILSLQTPDIGTAGLQSSHPPLGINKEFFP